MTADSVAQSNPTIVELPSAPEMLLMAADFPGFAPDELFRYWTDADLITRWWPHEASIDARPGGTYQLSWPSMNWVLHGTFTTFDPDRELAMTWQWEHEPDVAPIDLRLRFEPINGGTRLHLAHGPHPATEAGRIARQGQVDGWQHFLPKLRDQSQVASRKPQASSLKTRE